MIPDDWRDKIKQRAEKRPIPVVAHTFLRRWPTASRPVLLKCDDGQEYVVKGRQAGRMIVNDQVVGRLGRLLEAPMGEVALVKIPKELVVVERELEHIPPGIAHGCRWIPGCTEREGIAHRDIPENRTRFARLAIVYGWVLANDHQFIYQNQPPHLVHSVDHGHFFPGGPEWRVKNLQGNFGTQPDSHIVNTCCLTREEVSDATRRLEVVTEDDIAEAVAMPAEEWALSTDERVALAIYLAERRERLMGAVGCELN